MMSRIALRLLIAIVSLVMFFPILFAVWSSFLSQAEIRNGDLIPADLNLDSYAAAFRKVPLLTFLANSVIVSLLATAGQLLTCSLAAFGFVFVPFRGRRLIFLLFVATMIIPREATIVPNYLLVMKLGWLNTYAGLIVPFTTAAFGVFLLRQHFMTIPRDLYDSTQIDGGGRFRFYLSIVLPLSKPALLGMGIYAFLTTWNMYLWPLLVTDKVRIRTIQIGIKMLIAQEAATSWNVVMAGAVVVMAPTLILLFLGMNHIRSGLMSGAVKG